MNITSLRGKNYGVEHLIAQRSGPLALILNESLGLSTESCHFLLQFGSIYRNEERLFENTSFEIAEGDYLRVHTQPRRFPVQNLSWPECLIAETEDFIIINKCSGLPVHPTVDNTQENLCSLLSQKRQAPLYVTHRLDVATSGLILFAKTKSYQKQFNDYLMNSQVKKLYRATVHGEYRGENELIHYMEPSVRAPKKLSKFRESNWPQCRLKILDINYPMPYHSELMIELITGRTHQIRAQLSFEGHPVVGDQMYGSPALLSEQGEKIALQACYLSFPGHQFKLNQFNS